MFKLPKVANINIVKNINFHKAVLLWTLPFLSVFIVYKNFLNTNELMFKVNIEGKKKPVIVTPQPVPKPPKDLPVEGLHSFNAATVNSVLLKFNEYQYDLENKTVPRLQPNKIPADLKDVLDIKQKKSLFIQLMLPMAIDINNNIITKRQSVNKIIAEYANDKQLSPQNIALLKQLGQEFKVKYNDDKIPTVLSQLKHKVLPIPVSLILAQAIVESGWGTSRFSILGNALFGQWTYGKKSALVPTDRDEGKTHSIKSFDTPYQSMQAYVKNLNRNPAYRKLRQIRMEKGVNVSGIQLADGLLNYSQEKQKYVKKIKLIITSNKLQKYDSYVLKD